MIMGVLDTSTPEIQKLTVSIARIYMHIWHSFWLLICSSCLLTRSKISRPSSVFIHTDNVIKDLKRLTIVVVLSRSGIWIPKLIITQINWWIYTILHNSKAYNNELLNHYKQECSHFWIKQTKISNLPTSPTSSVLKYSLHYDYWHYSSFKLILCIAANM